MSTDAKAPNAAELLPKISTAWVWCTSVTDDRQTDGRATAYSEREHEFTFAKKDTFSDNKMKGTPLWGFIFQNFIKFTVLWARSTPLRQISPPPLIGAASRCYGEKSLNRPRVI